MLAKLRRAVAGDAVNRRANGDVGEVGLSLCQIGGGLGAPRLGLAHLRREHAKRLPLHRELGLGGMHGGLRLALVGHRLVGRLAGRIAAAHQLLGAAGIGDGAGLLGAGLFHLGDG
ncbi:MAG: hypothetical protein JWP20_2413 [Roseomonas sp.]|nr:hypothetical protein [Roseomonas sp.]